MKRQEAYGSHGLGRRILRMLKEELAKDAPGLWSEYIKEKDRPL